LGLVERTANLDPAHGSLTMFGIMGIGLMELVIVAGILAAGVIAAIVVVLTTTRRK